MDEISLHPPDASAHQSENRNENPTNMPAHLSDDITRNPNPAALEVRVLTHNPTFERSRLMSESLSIEMCGDEEEERELNRLRRRHEILRLKAEISSMERGDPAREMSHEYRGAAPPRPTPRRGHFSDIEHAIVKFSGEDRSYAVADFINNMEHIFEQVNADELLKNLTLRNSLTGAARLLLTRCDLTYEALKSSLISEFGISVSRTEVYRLLGTRSVRPGESVRRYIMEMEAISRRTDVEEPELVAFIQEGLSKGKFNDILFAAVRSMK